MKLLFTLLLLVSISSIFAQKSLSFNKNYQPFHPTQTDIQHVWETDSFYIAEGIHHNYGSYRFFLKFNKNGQIISSKLFPDTLFGGGSKYSNFFIFKNNHFININNVLDTATGQGVLIMVAFDYNFDSLWTKRYESLNINYGAYENRSTDIKQTPDGGYIIAGQLDKHNSPTVNQRYPYLMKTDNQGNIQWFKEYLAYPAVAFHKVLLTPDLGILVTTNNGSGRLIKMSALGIIQNSFNLNALARNFNSYDIVYTGNNIYTLAYSYLLNLQSSLNGLNIIKFDYSNWQIVHDTTYQPCSNIFYYPNLKIHTISNGCISISGTGSHIDSALNNGTYAYYNQYNGFLLTLSPNGDSLSTNLYESDTTETHDNWLNDMVQTSDGGFLGGGSLYAQNYNAAWIFKTDANGFLDYKTAIPSINNLFIYPNPTTDYIHIELPDISNEKYILYTIYNNIGVEIRSSKISNGNSQLKIETKNLSSGIYYIHITSETAVSIGKFIKK